MSSRLPRRVSFEIWPFVSALAPALSALGATSACAIYDESLLGTGGQPTTSTSSSDGGAGGAPPTSTSVDVGAAGAGAGATTASGAVCVAAAECPGDDTECGARTCISGACGVEPAAPGAPVAEQPKGDCATRECDGQGSFRDVANASDFIDDGNDCTIDGCSEGVSVNTPKAAGAPCQSTRVCTADGRCVECLDGGGCKSGVCKDFQCQGAACDDGVQNNLETDKDCGGLDCFACANGLKCKVNSDCASKTCDASSKLCVASCFDGLLNNGESDVDCGGPKCADCAVGKACGVDADCSSGDCAASKKCVCSGNHLLISEVRTRGAAGGSDEFIELYNPTPFDVKLDSGWVLEGRSHGSTASTYSVKWQGTGLTIPSRGHFLIAGSAYNSSPVADAALKEGVTDGGSLVLRKIGSVVDAVCFSYSAESKTNLETPANGFVCEGEPVSNLPHNNGSSGQSNSDASFERLPGGTFGNCIDTASSVSDFMSRSPAKPQNRFSPATPP